MDWFEFSATRPGAIPFALDRHGQWRDVGDVERGLACNCVCPECDGLVVAKKGEVRVHHFAHHDLRECRHALETSLFGMTAELLASPGAVLQLWSSPARSAARAAIKAEQAAHAAAAKEMDAKWRIPLSLPDVAPDAHVYQAIHDRMRGAIGSSLALELRLKWHMGLGVTAYFPPLRAEPGLDVGGGQEG